MTRIHRWLRHALVAIGAIAAPEAHEVSAVEAGRVQLLGALVCPQPIRSPLGDRECAAFFYRASAVGSGRSSSGVRMRTLLKVTVYAPQLAVALDDGSLVLSPPKSDQMHPDAHRRLVAQDLGGFRAREELLHDGQRVRVRGRAVASTQPGGWIIHVDGIEPVKLA